MTHEKQNERSKLRGINREGKGLMKRKNLTLENARINAARSVGARKRELNARHLLLHLDQLDHASPEDLAALVEYVRAGTWKSLYGHDRRMYLLLQAGVVNYKEQTKRLATLTMGKGESKVAMDDYRLEIEQRMHTHLDPRCLVTRKGNRIFVDIVGAFSEKELDHLARGAKRVWEWEAA